MTPTCLWVLCFLNIQLWKSERRNELFRRLNVVLLQVLAGLTETSTELGKTDSKNLKSKCCCIYLSVHRVGHQPSPCTSCMEQSSCLPGCTHSCKFCNRSCVEHHHSKQNKLLFWICQSTSCTCRSDLKTEQHRI
jgi:hypothetical protein